MKCEAIYRFDTAAVRFAFYPAGLDGPRVLADISEHVLRDLFGARGGVESLLRACENHFGVIEAKALEHYARAPSRHIQLTAQDFANAAGWPVSQL